MATDHGTRTSPLSSPGDARRWYAYCAACDWSGELRETRDEAEGDVDKHACGRIADPRAYVLESEPPRDAP